MKIFHKKIEIETNTQLEIIDITEQVEELIRESDIRNGQLIVFSQHTTMGVAINYNEPLLLQDFVKFMYRIAPVDEHYAHDLFELRRNSAKSDGRSNGHSHLKAFLTNTSVAAPIDRGNIALGKNQSIFALEFDGMRRREILVHIMGE